MARISLHTLHVTITWLFINAQVNSHPNNTGAGVYQNEWVVRIKGGPQVANLLALQSGYRHHGAVLGFEDTYLWYKDDSSNQRKRGNPRFTKTLSSHTKIDWVEQQKIIKRHKRDYVSLADLESERPLVREKRLPNSSDNSVLGKYASEDQKQHKRLIEDFGRPGLYNDELWNQEWYLQDTRTNKDLPKLDLNVLPLYRLGVTGHGIRVAVLDDGLEYTHDDLRNNYDPEISYDVNEGDNDPIPRYESTGLNGHGTRCAGEIAMEADNRKCGVGVSFEASIGGIKLLDGIVNDRVEGEALGYKPKYIDIYTASWGPADDGRSLEAPGRLATEALEMGISQGRAGRGGIYVWASGNGGSKADDCGCDGYVGSIYTIAVGSASQTGRFPWYGERCPATMATTYSSGAYYDQMITTTDLKNTCTTKHTGTSASAPLAAGILALALQVNYELTWRDMQHLIVWTSEYSPLRDNPGWFRNSAGFWFNPRFGFGLMNAYALVIAGYNWTTVPEKTFCEIKPTYISNLTLSYGNPTILMFNTDGCKNTKNEVAFLEHVQIDTNLEYTLRGALQMHLAAPSGTKVQMLNPRKLDDSKDGFNNWKFMSVASWGENPSGTWILKILDAVGPESNNGTIGDFTLIFHGTKEAPEYRKNGQRIYNNEYNRIRKMNKPETFQDEPSNFFNENWELTSKMKELEKIFQKDWLKRFLFT